MDAATGELLWEYARALPTDLNVYFPVPGINRNLAIYENKIINTSADGLPLRARHGDGRTGLGTPDHDTGAGAQHTSGPIIGDGKVISGRGCEPKGGPDAITGEIVWYYQHLVDHWDLDHPFERLLVDTVWRRILTP